MAAAAAELRHLHLAADLRRRRHGQRLRRRLGVGRHGHAGQGRLVKVGSPDTTFNDTTLLVKNDGGTNSRKAFASFSLAGYSNITSATLRLFVSSIGVETALPIPMSVYFGSAADSWSETTLTYNNAPAVSTLVSTQTIDTAQAGTWLEFNVTSQVAGETDGNATFMMNYADTTVKRLVAFSSKEGANAPQLVITTGTACTPTTCAALGKNCGSVATAAAGP